MIFLSFFAPLVAVASPPDPVDVYGKLTGKTILMPSTLPLSSDAMIFELATEKTNAISMIESEFAKQGIAAIQDGPHFVILFPENQRSFLTNILSLHGAELAALKSKEALPAGTINLFNVDAGTVLSIYAVLGGRTVLRPATLPYSPVRLKTTCPVTREEATYAMETVFALNGIALVKDGEKFFQAVPMVQRARVNAGAPMPDPSARLLDPNKVPSSGNYELSKAQVPSTVNHELSKAVSKMERDLDKWRKALYEFIHYKTPPDRSAQRLLGLYASLAGKTSVPSKEFDGIPIWFHIDTPLCKSELMYAIETTFDLNWLRIVEVDEQHIRLGRISERGPHAGKEDANLHPKQ